jgi:hypothetical protein
MSCYTSIPPSPFEFPTEEMSSYTVGMTDQEKRYILNYLKAIDEWHSINLEDLEYVNKQIGIKELKESVEPLESGDSEIISPQVLLHVPL